MNCFVKPALLGLMVGAALGSSLAPSYASAAPPKINRLSVRGFQSGATTRVTISGTDLLPEPKLVLDVPIASQAVVGPLRSNQLELDVTLDKDVTPGVYHMRLATSEGITAAEIVAIDALKQQVASNNVESLPVAVHGAVSGSAVQEIKFQGKQDEQITVDVLAVRIGSKLRPVAHLYDSTRKQIGWSLPLTSLAGDARFTAKLPADDTYTVAVHDLAYNAANPGFFRAAIGRFDYVDQVFPPVTSGDASMALDWIGRVAGQTSGKFDATASSGASSAGNLGVWRPVAWPAGAVAVGLRPRLQVSNLPEVAEDKNLDSSRTLPAAPVGVSGCLKQPGEEDVYSLTVATGDKLRFDVFADRLGSPIDATLELRNEKGARLATIDDTVGPDPRTDYTVPANVSKLFIAVTDAYRRGGADSIYRIEITRGDRPATDFRLTIFEDTHHVATAGAKVFRVIADRTNFDAAIKLEVAGLPPGFSASPVEIPAKSSGALVEIRRSAEATSTPSGKFTVRGQSVGVEPAITRVAEMTSHPLGQWQPWLKYDLAVASTSAPQALTVAWDDASADNNQYLGIDGKLKVKFERQPGVVGPLKLSLVTTQAPAAGNARQQAAQLLRGTTDTIDLPIAPPLKAAADALKAAETALAQLEKQKPKQGEPDAKLAEQITAAEAKRNEAQTKLNELASKPDSPYDYALLVPADLPTADYDIAIRAELRSVDNQTVVAESFTTPRRITIKPPMEFAIAMPTEPVALEKAGATITLDGTIKRLAGFAGDVTLTLNGLPAGVAPPRVVVKAKEEKFQLQFKLPPNFAADKVENVQLNATFIPDARRANVNARYDQPLAAIAIQKAEAKTAAN